MSRFKHKQFPPQKDVSRASTQARRNRGANNQRLPVSEAAPVAFAAPIARHNSEAHETPELTRDGEGVPKVVPRGQLPGCLPQGYDLDSLLTVEQFAIWRQKSEEIIRNEIPTTNGVVSRTRKDIRIHPRTYLEKSMKGVR